MNQEITSRRRLLALAACSALGSIAPTLSHAQAYPSKPIRLVHGFGAGSSIDVVARVLSDKLTAELGQSLIVDSKPGATGTIANQYVISSPPDGYTLLINPLASIVTASHIFPVKYNVLKDLVPISQVAFFDTVLVVGPSVKATNVAELISEAKGRREPMTFSSPGSGTGFHIAGEMFSQMADVPLLHVPYRGGGTAALTDLIAGRVDMTFESLGAVLSHVQAGTLRAMAVTGKDPSPALAKVPTLSATLPGYELTGWHGVFAPAQTPTTIVNRLNSAVTRVLSAPDVQQRWATMNLRFTPMTPQAFAQQIAADDVRYAKIIRERNIKVE